MKFNFVNEWQMDVQGVILLIDEDLKFQNSMDEAIHEDINQQLSLFNENKVFLGKIGEKHFTKVKLKQGYLDVALLGLGSFEHFDLLKLQHSLAEVYRQFKKLKLKKVLIDAHLLSRYMDSIKKRSIAIAETITLAAYEFNDFKSDVDSFELIELDLMGIFDEDAVEEGIFISEATNIAKHLVNLPANILTPSELAQRVEAFGKMYDFEVEVKGESDIKALEMDAFLSVSKGSNEEPKLIVMRYNGNPSSDQKLGYVGKGLTYDSGGLSIKPTNSMVNMKDDMGGSAAVIGAMIAIAKMRLKVNVTAVIAACENMISGGGYKPGDIISSMAKKTIFVGNTDAEGRLTLVDAVHYIIENEDVTAVVDVATLTGAALHCLGTDATCAISNNDDYFELVSKGFGKSNEKIWRFPIFDEYKELLKHHEADLTNVAGQPGMITAGLFIGEFVQDLPWVHLDIAGTAFKEKASGLYTKGGTGVGVRPLYYVAKKLSVK